MIAQFNGHAKRWTVLAAVCMLALAALALTDAVRGDDAGSRLPLTFTTKPAASTQPVARVAESEHGVSARESAMRAQFQRSSDWIGSMNLSGSEDTSTGRHSRGKAKPMMDWSREKSR